MNELNFSWNTATAILGFGVGIACGFAIAWFGLALGRKNRELKEKLNTLRSEHEAYRQQVNQHFMKSADLVQTMTDSYRAVYEHLAVGSEQLCKDPLNAPKLDIPQQTRISDPGKPSTAQPHSSAPSADHETIRSMYDEYPGDMPQIPDTEVEEFRKNTPRNTNSL